jgi:multiple sugar transport system permease protein
MRMAATATGVKERKRASFTGAGRAGAPAGHRFIPLNRRTTERLVLIGFLVPALTYVALFFVYPLYQDISISFQDYGFSALASGHGTYVGFANYTAMLNNSTTTRALLNTLIFTVASVVFQFTIGFGLAVYLNTQFAGSGFLRRFILVPWVIPFVVTGTIFSLIFATSNGLANQILESLGLIHSPIGWLTNGYLALTAIIIANIWAGVPFNAVLLYSGLQDVPAEQLEAAAVDGANSWQRFRRVTVPSMRPVILIVLMLGVVYTAKVFDLPWVLTGGGPANESQLMSTWAYTQAFSTFNFGTGTAVANILLLFTFLVGVVYIVISRGEGAPAGRRIRAGGSR